MSDSVIEFEELKEEDLKIVAELYDNDSLVKTDLIKMHNVYREIKDNEFYKMIVAKLNKKIVGFAYVNLHKDIFEKCKPYMTIWSIRVKNDYRRQGIGTKLFNYIEELAKDKKCSFMCLIAENDNIGANEFYKAIGYNKENGYVKILGR